VLDEILLRPGRATREARGHYARGNHPQALEAFERAARARPGDGAARFNMADGLYKNGRYGEAATLFRSLAEEAKSPLAAPSRFNLGNSLYQQQDFRGAVQAYRDALRAAPADEATRRNLELALQALRQQQEQQKRQQQDQSKQDQKKDGERQRDRQQQAGDQKGQTPPQPGEQQPKAPQEREDERFRQETGMPKERAMQLLDALQQNEKAEQKKLLAQKRAQRKKGKDW
jgi:tetratricopeptide (TPR) repeat protein